MTTLTSTGNVSLSASTNWSPAQIPVAGDDLIINGAHTLTLDADMTLGSLTFSNASARLAISGTTRTVTATNGFIVNANLSSTLITTAIPSGTSLTLNGTWSGNAALSGIASSTGGNLTLQPADLSAGSILFADVVGNHTRRITDSWTNGTLTTVGRFNLASWTNNSTIVTMTSGIWNHTHTGTSYLGTGLHVLASISSITWNWSGDLISNATGVGFITIGSGVSTLNFLNGSVIKRSGASSASNLQAGTYHRVLSVSSAAGGTIINLDGVICSAVTSRCIAIDITGTSRLNWRNQSRSIGATDAVVMVPSGNAITDLTGLQITNAGRFAYIESGLAEAVVDVATVITNSTSSAQACVISNSGALDGKVITLQTDVTLPDVEDVAAGIIYGYDGDEDIGTGLVVDPALFAAAVNTALANYETNGVASANDLADATPDLTPVLDHLPETGRASTQASVDSLQTDINGALGYLTAITSTVDTIATGVALLLTRVTASVYETWLDLKQMISGTGTADAQFTVKALENASCDTSEILEHLLEIKGVDFDTYTDSLAALGGDADQGDVLIPGDGPFYTTREMLELVYGTKNITKWADLDNEEDEDFIADRIATMISLATEITNDALRAGMYTVPIVSPYPQSLVYHVSCLAGVLLYESRGEVDAEDEQGNHRLTPFRRRWDKYIKELLGQKVQIDAERVSGNNAPFAG